MRSRFALALAAVVVASVTGCTRQAATSRPGPTAPVVTTTAAELDRPIAAAFVGAGTLETSDARLALERLDVTATTTGDVAEVSVEHVFRNDSDRQLEGTFRFPVPERALVTGLAMEIDGKLMEGELVARDLARKVYEKIVDQMLDPALLEWEGGGTFKLRVFPIEPRSTKRVVLRLVAPLHRDGAGMWFAYRAPSGDVDVGAAERMHLAVDGKGATSSRRAPSGEVLVKVADRAPEIVVERAKDATYAVAHVRVSGLPGARRATAGRQAVVVAADRSRSMLEARALQRSVVEKLASELGKDDRITAITGDVRARAMGALRPPSEAAEVARFVDASEPDGASDLGALLEAAGAAARDARKEGFTPTVVLLGDATPTWGETRTSELEAVARRALGDVALHVVVLGKSGDETTARALAAATHGRVVRPRSDADARHAAKAIAAARSLARVEDVAIEGASDLDVPTSIPRTLYEGDELEIALAAKSALPSSIRLAGKVSGQPFVKELALASAPEAKNVGKRWASAKLEALGRKGDETKDEVVATSLAHGVMSRHTSFLVLESEEAYAQHQIARKAKSEARERVVDARDVDGADRVASVTPDHLQPGDPEVRIPAPRDARGVVVVFPFGETKPAVFEDDARGGAWVARFLVDRETPDGTYTIVARVTHADGRVEVIELPYVVDTKAPQLEVKTRRRPDGSIEIRAKQVLDDEQRETDAKRAEVRAPDGQVIELVHLRLGEFVGTWRPRPPDAAAGTLRVVAVDRALNERVTEVEIR